MAKANSNKSVETFIHEEATRKNIPTAEHESVMHQEQKSPIRVAYERRNRDLDPQLVWRGKDEQDWSDLVVQAPPLYIQEKVHPKVLIDDLRRRTERAEEKEEIARSLFADLYESFNGLDEHARTEFYQHDQNWTNRMILGDSLQVMASLAEREGLRGQVQCIYIDPPYGIKFNSNFQWSTSSRDVKDGNVDHITREPEQVKAFRDTWRDGIHSYLTYLRDRMTVARDLLTESGSIFVQIGDENVHRVRTLMEEVFGEDNFVVEITYTTTAGRQGNYLDSITDHILWFSKSFDRLKYRQLASEKIAGEGKGGKYAYAWDSERMLGSRVSSGDDTSMSYAVGDVTSQGATETGRFGFHLKGKKYFPGTGRHWSATESGMTRLDRSLRLIPTGDRLMYRRMIADFPVVPISNIWDDTSSGGSQSDPKVYVVQTRTKIIQRCLLMTTDPGDLVLDPTCGSGTTAFVAEQWGRRWITIDTSRVALALARARIMGARYPYYLLADSPEGQQKEGEVTQTVPSTQPTQGNIRHGFVYERVPHITLKSIANNTEVDVIWEKWQEPLSVVSGQLYELVGKKIEEWEMPRQRPDDWPPATDPLLAKWWQVRIARQKEIDASIAAKADNEYLYDKPYEDKRKVRVAGPFTVESLSPHRVLGVDENDELIDPLSSPPAGGGVAAGRGGGSTGHDFISMILENLQTAGVQQAHKEDKIDFTSLVPWPGEMVCAEGRYEELGAEKRAAIFVGPEFGTVSRPDLVAAAREAGDAGFDVLIACAFNYDALSSEFDKLGRIPVLKARMNADLHMADDLKNTGKGNLFVIFGEPDIDVLEALDGKIQIKVNGVDVFHPNTGEVRSDGAEGIACWFIDTDYNEESFFVRHAYFLGAGDPYKSLKTTLKAEINEEAWSTLHSDTSRPFDRPTCGRIAVKVINHLGDEVMKVFRV